MKKIKMTLALLLVVGSLYACQDKPQNMQDGGQGVETEVTKDTLSDQEAGETAQESVEDAEEQAAKEAEEDLKRQADAEAKAKAEAEAMAQKAQQTLEDYETYKVNEMGQLMVVMYHNLAETPGTYASTPALFRTDLERLYASGYRPVNLSDVINNTIDIPLGTTPIVLTFDDGYKSDIYYNEAGEIAEDSVAGIMKSMADTYDDFNTHAIFYIYGQNPFREKDLIGQKLEDLVAMGFEIGNHTNAHDELNVLSAEGIQAALGKENNFINQYLPGYQMKHVCYPKGLKPDESIRQYVFSGQYDGQSYSHISGVNVGWNPTVPYGHHKFNAQSINRVTCGDDDFELQYWLDYFDNHPEKRYISDGNPDTLVIPEHMVDQVDQGLTDEVIIYKKEEE